MASLMENYEQQYSNLSADIVAKIGRIPNLTGGEKTSAISHVERSIEEAKEVLEQMELEAREVPATDRQKYFTRLKSYRSELANLEKDLKKSRIAFSDEMRNRDELLGLDDGGQSEDQRTRLLDNTERLERSGRRLDHGYQTVLETEKLGAQVLEDLHDQREQIQRSRERLRETNVNIGKSSRLLSAMVRRIIQNRILLIVIGIILLIVIIVGIYFATRKSS